MRTAPLFISFVLLLAVSCKPDIEGCTDPKALNYNAQATIDNNNCVYETNAGTDTNDTDSTSVTPVYGCTDTAASNYDPNATHDDGSCLYPGCTDPKAENYDPNANVDDGSCIDTREKFRGTWDVTSNCQVPVIVNTPQSINYDTTVTDTVDFSPFVIGSDAFGLIDRDSVRIPSQTYSIFIGTMQVNGRGAINSTRDKITIALDYDAGIAGAGSCTLEYTKQ